MCLYYAGTSFPPSSWFLHCIDAALFGHLQWVLTADSNSPNYRGARLLRTTLNADIEVIRTKCAKPAWPTRYAKPRLIRTMISTPDKSALTNVSVLSGDLCTEETFFGRTMKRLFCICLSVTEKDAINNSLIRSWFLSSIYMNFFHWIFVCFNLGCY